MKENADKTNAMRMLDRAKIAYRIHTYDGSDGHIDGLSVAEKTGLPAERVYKTLVTAGHSRANYVFVIPVGRELDLKKAARSVGEKSVEMIHAADLFRVTGYIRGGCSPVGMKKTFVTRIDAGAEERGQDRHADRALAGVACGAHPCGICRPSAKVKNPRENV